MTGRFLALLVAAGVGALLLALYSVFRTRLTAAPERLLVDELGLELMSGCCAFIVFTSPACRPCKSAIQVARRAMEQSPNPTELLTVDATERSDIAIHYGVRTIPTTFLITASGHVIERWIDVPELDDVKHALAQI
jgi:hypothetical protein